MIKSGFSFNTAVGHLEDVASRIKEVGWEIGPIADRGNTFGWVKWTSACKQAGLRPVYGAEIGIIDGVAEKRPNVDYWTLLAVDSVAPLNDLVSEATSNPGREPILTYKRLLAAKGVIKIAGERCLASKVNWRRKDVYLGLSPATPVGLYKDVLERNGKMVAVPRNVYPRREDLEFYRVALGNFRASTQTYDQHIVDDEEWRDAVWYASDKFAAAALRTRQDLLDSCTAVLKPAKLLNFDKTKSLMLLCCEGAKKLGLELTPAYEERLGRELAMIAEKNFEDYFYIIADIVAHAKTQMVVGPARGSSCGSLVCYLLGITAIDPIPHGLLFERFIDVTRADLPDIDLDFSDAKRHMVFKYVEEKYGSRAARLGSVGTFQGSSALNQVAVALKIPQWVADSVSETLIKRSVGDSRADSTIADTLASTDAGQALISQYPEAKIVERFEDHPRNAGQHAAGLIVTDKPVGIYVAIDNKTRVAMCDKYDAEALNLLKIDVLGLTQLSVFERVMELIGVAPISGWLEKIPLDDLAAYDLLNHKRYCGVFQFAGSAMRNLAKQIKFERFDDVVAATALVRPGPMASGGSSQWVMRRSGREEVSYPHPLFEPFLRDTYGVVCYQEQILQIGREIGDLSWADVTALRKAMSKSLGKEYFDQFGDRWKPAAVAKGVPEEVAAKFWDGMCAYGAWAFNKCLVGETRVKRSHGGVYFDGSPYNPTIAYLYKRQLVGKPQPWLISLNNLERGVPQQALKIHKNGKRECVRLWFDDGSTVACTPDHRFIIDGKWKRCSEAEIGSKFMSLSDWNRPYEKNGRGIDHVKGQKNKGTCGWGNKELNVGWTTGITYYFDEFKSRMKGMPCQRCGKKAKRMEAHHLDFNSGKDDPKALQWLCVSCHKKVHYDHGRTKRWEHGKVISSKILVEMEPIGIRMTYDIEMPEYHNFMLANGLVTHNSHSVSYAYVSYWCAYLKAHHPVEFAAATLDAEKDPVKQIEILRELREEGVDYVAVDPVRSTDRWTIVSGPNNSKKLLGPLTNIHGIGPAKVATILSCRKNKERLPGKALQEMLDPPIKTKIDSLYPIRDWVVRTHPGERVSIKDENGRTHWANHERFKTLATVNSIQLNPSDDNWADSNSESVLVIGTPARLAGKNENEPVKVAKRGYALEDPVEALHVFLRDDTDEIFCKVNRFDFARWGRAILERGKANKALYVVKGDVRVFRDGFRAVFVTAMHYLGDLD